MQKPGLTYAQIHDLSINTVQIAAETYGWELGYGKLKEEDLRLLESGSFGKHPVGCGAPGAW
ncbi:hypothetical protein D8682_04660 [Buttiauxella sp. 3AFRM03]|nr:hypothetical protein D8682_04660 [Buttiauxella sp. 3AFRM03]